MELLCAKSVLLDGADDAHGGLLVVLAQGVVLQDLDVQVAVHAGIGGAQDLALQVVDVNDDDPVAQLLGALLGDLVGVLGTQNDVVVVGRNGVVAGAVDGTGLVAGHGVEPALLLEDLLADDGNGGGEEDPGSADLLQSHLHGLGHAQADAVGGLSDVVAQPHGQLPGMDVGQGDGAALGAGDALLGNEQDVILVGHDGSAVLVGDLDDVVVLGDQVGLDGQALVGNAVDDGNALLALVGSKLSSHIKKPSFLVCGIFYQYNKSCGKPQYSFPEFGVIIGFFPT